MHADDALLTLLGEPARSLQTILDAAPMAMIIIDRAGLVYRWSPAAETILGWTADEMAQQPNPIFADVAVYDEVWRGQKVTLPEHRVINRHGEAIFLRVALAPLYGHDDAPIAAIIMADDVTQRALTRQVLERRVRDRSRRLTMLYAIMASAAESQNEGELLQAALTRVVDVTHASGGAIQLHEAGELRLRVERDLPDRMRGNLAGLTRKVFTSGAPLVVNDLQTEASNIALRRSGLSIFVCVPMNSKMGIVGTLSVVRVQKRPFARDDLALLQSVADQIAVGLDNLRLRAQNESLLLIEERNRLARELHDRVTQSLYSLLLMTGAGRRQVEQGDLEALGSLIERLQAVAQQALKEMRLLIHNLRPSALTAAGLVGALRQRLDAVEERAGVKTVLNAGDVSVPATIDEALYAIAQEALNNSLKHSGATQVTVDLARVDNSILLRIADNGSGFDHESRVNSGGLGLISMQERAAKLKADFQLESPLGAGTTITVRVPLRRS